MSRGFRVFVEYGSIEYSAVSQPPVTPCSFIQRGTVSSIITPQITRVFPIATSTDPVAWGAIPSSNEIERIWSRARPSVRCMAATLKHQAPTSKLQRDTKSQGSKQRAHLWILVFGASLVLGAWSL